VKTIVSVDQHDQRGDKAPTGLFFHEQSVDSLIDAVGHFNKIEREFDPLAIRNQALQWDREIFKGKIKDNIFKKMESRC